MANTIQSSAKVYAASLLGGARKKNGNRFMVAIFQRSTREVVCVSYLLGVLLSQRRLSA
jgi:hypothetical protein